MLKSQILALSDLVAQFSNFDRMTDDHFRNEMTDT